MCIRDSLKGMLVKDWSINGLNIVGLFCISILILYLAMNFTYNQSPFPIGFDSRNFYMNISKQVALKEGLIYGFRPYNWAILMSMGFVIFKSTAVGLSLSFYGYILSLFAIFHLGARRLKINPNHVLLAMLVLTASPAITNQLYVELKTDFGLLFFQILTVSFFLSFVSSDRCKAYMRSTQIEKAKLKALSPYLIILGLFVGFGLGIKMTNMFLLFSIIICLFWLFNDDKILTSGVILLTLALFMIVRLDDLSGVRLYHLGLNSILMVLLGSGVVAMGYSLYRNRNAVFKPFVLVCCIGLISMTTMSPWLIKNFNETRSLSPKTLLNGAPAGPDININTLHNNYINSLDN